MAQRRYYRRTAKAQSGRRRRKESGTAYQNPRVDPALKPVLRRIGVPEPGPFIPDPFQNEALELIEDFDVLVSAPTGAGKTWIASQVIHAYITRGRRVWYASPLKALSNSIYKQFCHEFGAANCGILTGDRKENPEAPVIVGTTEILRNQLYDAMHRGISIRADLVILDEAHYLSDPDRGVVWEEVLIYLPAGVKLLLLSATISNAEEICAWLEDIRGTANRVVRAEGRPVPLEMLFLFPDGLIVPLGGRKGLNPRVRKYLSSARGRRHHRPSGIDFGSILRCLRRFNLLPAIFFLKSRMDCDRALSTCPPVRRSEQEMRELEEMLKSFMAHYPHLQGHRQIRPILESRVASHHGGQLPYWKVLIEEVMNKGYLDAIFSTSTVAAGVNFPARTVAIVPSDRFNGHEFVDLTATELHQMIGRAGRRGKDEIGFALVIPGPYQNPGLIHELRGSRPEPVLSQIRINFSMTLNLLLSHTPEEVKNLVERSFAAFQERDSEISHENRWNQVQAALKKLLPEALCDTSDPFEVSELIEKRRELKKAIKKQKKYLSYGQSVRAWTACLEPGTLFLHKNGNIYANFEVQNDEGRCFSLAYNIRKSASFRKQQLRVKRIDLNQIESVFDYRVHIPNPHTPGMLDELFRKIPVNELTVLDPGGPGNGDIRESGEGPGLESLERELGSMPCEQCRHLKVCHGKERRTLRKILGEFQMTAELLSRTGRGLWLSFRRHLRFLNETGFVDSSGRLTPDGYWASKLRLDQPLVIAEAIRKGAFDHVSPEILAGVIAPFVWDRALETDLRMREGIDLTELENAFYAILRAVEGIRDLKKRRGFAHVPILFWPAAALFMWARGMPWDKLLEFVSVDEGDLASLVMRTADHLRQVANLKQTHPELADVAEHAVEMILREPVFID